MFGGIIRWFFHFHKWKIIKEYTLQVPSKTKYNVMNIHGIVYDLQCESCGKMKHKVYDIYD